MENAIDSRDMETSIDAISDILKEPAWMRDIRKDSWNCFLGLPPPKFRYGISLNMDMSDTAFPYDFTISRNEKGINVEADSRVKVLTFREAFEDENVRDILGERFMNLYGYGGNRLTAFHGSFFSHGTIIILPDGTETDEHIRISMDMESDYFGTHIIIVAGEGSRASFEEFNTGGTSGYRSHAVELFAGEGSKITYESVQSLGKDVFDSRVYRADISADAEVKWFTALLGGNASKAEASTSLSGRGARSENFGLFLGRDDVRYDIYNSSIHTAPDTYSDMNNRGVAKHNSKAIYRGLIRIGETAKNCNGYQTHDSLMLSGSAESHAVPNLEINNNDVKCSHGATIGQVDEESIFYLMSRGLGRQEAEEMIVSGFLESMTGNATSERIKEHILKVVGAQ